MSRMSRIWVAIVTGFLGSFVIPAVAWAHESGVAEELRRRPKIGFFGGLGALCCLVVVGGIVLIVFLVQRNRKR